MNFRVLKFPLFLLAISSGLFVQSCSLAKGENPNPENTLTEGSQVIKKEAPRTGQNPNYTRPTYAPPRPQPSPNTSNGPKISYSKGRTDIPYLALTFDDGPHPQNTPRLLDILKEKNIKATFFVIGRSVDLYPQIAARIIAEGHEIGNHTYTHGNLSKMSQAKVVNELNRGRDAIKRATGVLPRIMRPPYGALLTSQRKWVYDNYGYPAIFWSVDPLDWKDRKPAVVTSRLLKGASNGGILLAHDLHKTTVDAMPETIDRLLTKGYRFVTVSELISY